MKKLLLHILSLLLLPLATFGQGSLNPAGPPAPTMQTLDQLGAKADQANAKADAINAKSEKRIPVGNATTPGNDSYDFIIAQPGSYYLTANLAANKTNGIQVNAEGVTLDLNGFEIARASGSGGNGIEIPATSHRATIRNGSIKGFAYGVRSLGFGSPGGSARACTFRGLSVSNCTTVGIFTGVGAVLESCRVHDNSGMFGIFADAGSALTDCTAAFNTVGRGIFANIGSSLTNCSAFGNTSADADSAGIATGTGSTISHCTAHSNVSTATSTPSTGMGFSVGHGSNIHGCTAANNEGDGIRLLAQTIARDNSCYRNGNGGDGAGIHSIDSDNRIESNNVTGNDRGIDVDVAGNLIIKNSASGNTTANYDIVANNVFGAVVDRTAPASGAVQGNSAASSAGTTDPWANISY